VKIKIYKFEEGKSVCKIYDVAMANGRLVKRKVKK